MPRCIRCGRYMDRDLYDARAERGMTPFCWACLDWLSVGRHDHVAFWKRVLSGEEWQEIRPGEGRWEP